LRAVQLGPSALVRAHEAAVVLDICCEDCDEASADCNKVRHERPNANLGQPVWLGDAHPSTPR